VAKDDKYKVYVEKEHGINICGKRTWYKYMWKKISTHYTLHIIYNYYDIFYWRENYKLILL